ncbi:MAG: hypothetical protein EH225_06125 [Calditrichaeota bacterium]|nr:hypothetical protein [Calditrichota bacterium]RQV93095.1 MAG: hypothetical protein EH221_10290 [bacterium]RQW04259.1 MAG: hypothetical protein EH225_06125 [Calditrichota bacterium]
MKTIGRIWLILFAAVSISWSQTYPVIPIGQYWHFPDARSMSLAGAGSVSLKSPGAMLYNPAALTQIEHSVTLELSFKGRNLQERRSYPLYDRFDGFLVDATYAVNDNWYSQIQGGVALGIPFYSLPRLSVAVGSYPEIDFRYNYNEEVRENVFGDELIAYNRIEANGLLRRYSAALAAVLPFLPDLSVGMQVGIINGDAVNYEKLADFVQRSQKVIFAQDDRKLDNSPVVLSAGAIYRASERFSLGFHLSLPYKIESSTTNAAGTTFREEAEYPLRINAGMEYRARQELQARLNVDIGYEFWSQTEFYTEMPGVVQTIPFAGDSKRFSDFTDVFYIKTGIEHIFYNRIPFGVGAQYQVPTGVGAQYHLNPTLSRGTTHTLLSTGTGFFNTSWRVDISAAYSKLSYRWEDLFDDALYVNNPNFQSRRDRDSVDETTLFFQISMMYFLDF